MSAGRKFPVKIVTAEIPKEGKRRHVFNVGIIVEDETDTADVLGICVGANIQVRCG